MATYNKGILGPFQGKVGTIVGSNRKDVNYVRRKPTLKNRTVSDAQALQRSKVSIITRFVKTLTTLIRTTFAGISGRMTGYNLATKYALRHAIAGTAPDFTIDYSKVLVSRGNLPNESDAKAVAAADAVRFTWTDTSGNGLSSPTDRAILVVYCEAENKSAHTLHSADRSAGTPTLNVPAGFKGHPLQTWISFISADGKQIATSRFTGQVTIA